MLGIVPAGELGGDLGEEVGGATAARLSERRGVVRQAGRSRRPVVGRGAALAQLVPVEGATACRPPGEAQAVGGSGPAADAVRGGSGCS